ncbi:MAG TPA: hypothetical protein PL048_06935 [Leptospiraceae bacterium]|nr:hypothetical protein [Leptospiraceae bacterium]HMY67337.1 hypothetical protein [Leptospiraceae bacterium]HMZ58492.1 hypothetical protein [Leptospiraceae bacterium]HNF15415.1 hypothetical protein [Leptospiraceae bacterium]HNF26571.1 hypothetical protein [Leptospiraceae bacterium]
MKQNIMKNIALTAVFAFFAWGLWLGEILYFTGWKSLDWLRKSLFSPYIILILLTFSFMNPLLQTKKAEEKLNPVFPALVFAAALLCFFSSEVLMRLSYCRSCFLSETQNWLLHTGLVSDCFIFGFLLQWIAEKYSGRMPRGFGIVLALGAVFAALLSLITVKLFPGYGNGADWVDAVKMGYPVFYSVLLTGLSSLWASLKLSGET